ncbi:MAG TPA: hypothetical protein PK507_05165 [bacterium]|nr:hypothetical protein [bacterium]
MNKTKNKYNLANITNKIINSGFIIFTSKTLKEIFGVNNNPSFFSILNKMVDSNILIKLERGKYLLNIDRKEADKFFIANSLYSPSYISFETALNFYGILPQFPYEITSATVKKSVKKNIDNVVYSYTHIKNSLFFGYEKKGNILIANPEKALLDQIYLSLKGFKKIDINDYNLTNIKKTVLKEYFSKYPRIRQTKKMREIINKI